MSAVDVTSSVDVLQACLAGEHAALYGYGVVGGVLAVTARKSPDRTYAQTSYDEHRARRDDLSRLIAGLGATPVEPRPGYATPFEVVDHNGARRLARDLEHATAVLYGLAVSSTVDATRGFAAHALTDCAVREVAWGATPEAFPGIDGP